MYNMDNSGTDDILSGQEYVRLVISNKLVHKFFILCHITDTLI